MKYFSHRPSFLTDPTDWAAILLTLMFYATFPLHAFSANGSNVGFVADSLHYNNAIDYNDEQIERSTLTNYLRHQAINSVPTLSDDVRGTVRWAMNGFQMGRGLLDFGFSSVNEETGGSTDTHAVAHVMSSPEADTSSSWLASTTYHHNHGFSPTHDAMMFGTHAKNDFADHYMQFDIHPYVGQSWMSANNYYGTDISLNLAAPQDTSRTTSPWGKIVLGYTNGESRLTDSGRGINLHGDVRFSDNLTLSSGLRQSDTTGNSNYVLLQWKLIND